MAKGHAPRRKRIPGQKLARKMYPYVRKDQKGTFMDTHIPNHTQELEKDGNAKNGLNQEKRLPHTKAQGRYKQPWAKNANKGTSARAVSDHQKKNGGTRRDAKAALKKVYEVSFGADPKSR